MTEDMHLMFDNAKQFNVDGSVVYEDAVALCELFDAAAADAAQHLRQRVAASRDWEAEKADLTKLPASEFGAYRIHPEWCGSVAVLSIRL
jgi:hypothetical protein